MRLLFDLCLLVIFALPAVTVITYVALYIFLHSIAVLCRTVAWWLMQL